MEWNSLIPFQQAIFWGSCKVADEETFTAELLPTVTSSFRPRLGKKMSAHITVHVRHVLRGWGEGRRDEERQSPK